MPRLFGIDIAGIVHSSTRGQLFAGTLTRTNRSKIQNFTLEGVPIIEEESQNIQAISKSGQQQILIIANSITPRTVPRITDVLKLLEKQYGILAVEPDPAEATYVCIVEALQ